MHFEVRGAADLAERVLGAHGVFAGVVWCRLEDIQYLEVIPLNQSVAALTFDGFAVEVPEEFGSRVTDDLAVEVGLLSLLYLEITTGRI